MQPLVHACLSRAHLSQSERPFDFVRQPCVCTCCRSRSMAQAAKRAAAAGGTTPRRRRRRQTPTSRRGTTAMWCGRRGRSRWRGTSGTSRSARSIQVGFVSARCWERLLLPFSGFYMPENACSTSALFLLCPSHAWRLVSRRQTPSRSIRHTVVLDTASQNGFAFSSRFLGPLAAQPPRMRTVACPECSSWCMRRSLRLRAAGARQRDGGGGGHQVCAARQPLPAPRRRARDPQPPPACRPRPHCAVPRGAAR